MKSVFTEKKNVAWFTLAECVSRGERERAFGVYRLLSHSLDDRALAAQLEADLLCAFNMPEEALESYEKAMRMYKQEGKLLEAAAVCEHMRFIKPDDMRYIEQALVLYSSAQSIERASEMLIEYVTNACARGMHEAVGAIADAIQNIHGYAQQGFCYEQVVSVLSRMANVPVAVRILYAHKAAHAYVQHGSQEALKKFLAQLQVSDHAAYEAVLKELKS